MEGQSWHARLASESLTSNAAEEVVRSDVSDERERDGLREPVHAEMAAEGIEYGDR